MLNQLQGAFRSFRQHDVKYVVIDGEDSCEVEAN